MDKRLYLRLGDHVFHSAYDQWGKGAVVQVMTSVVPGGTCLVRILFEDGQERTFNNDMDSETCCYYFGMRRQPRLAVRVIPGATPTARTQPRRRLTRAS
jgi:hypothetical protein